MAGSRRENRMRFRFQILVTPMEGMERAEILRLFAAQYNVAHVRQLTELGVSPRTIRRRRELGTWSRVLESIVRLAGADDTFESRAMSLVLYCGPPCFLSGTTAGALHGLRNMPRSRVEITVPLRKRADCPPWGRFVGASWIDLDRDVVVRPDGLRVASPLRMLFNLAGQFNQHRFERAAEDAWHLGLVTPASAADYLGEIRRQGRSGVARFETWLEKTRWRARASQSGLELIALDMIREAGLPEPERQHPLVLRDGTTIHLDFAWPDAQLAVEPGHSWWHGGDLGQRADQARDRACDEVGWRVVRYDESVRDQLRELGPQLARIFHARRRLLGHRTS
jgi:very-short-patch-repair endonuclease